MAKSLRSSTRKANKRKLRAGTFAPVEAARTARLSNKLLHVVQQSAKTNPDASINSDAGQNHSCGRKLPPHQLMILDIGEMSQDAQPIKDRREKEIDREGGKFIIIPDPRSD